MRFRFTLLLMLLLAGLKLGAQSCQVVSADYVCVSELISFKVQVGGGSATGWSWAFGDGQTSTLSEPGNRYTKAGTYTVQVTVQLAGGGSCKAQKTIDVYALPNAQLSLVSIDSCLNSNKICLKDLSKPATVSQQITSRIILWDDGAASSSSTPAADPISCHSYARKGVFQVLMEVVDNKGCKARASIRAAVVDDIRARFSYQLRDYCDSAVICFDDASDTAKARLLKWQWKQNGTTLSKPRSWCTTLKSAGDIRMQYWAENQYGCRDTFSDTIRYSPTVLKPKIRLNIHRTCYGKKELFTTETDSIDGARYFWNLYDIRESANRIYSTDTAGVFAVEQPGRYRITLQVVKGYCVARVDDTLLVLGPKALAKLGNDVQCRLRDTVYFEDRSDYWGVTRPGRIWFFNDMKAAACTTRNSSKPDYSCNYSLQQLARHWYADSQRCWFPTLIVRDSATGCADTMPLTVRIRRMEQTDIYTVKQPPLFCTGQLVEFRRAKNDPCEIPVVKFKGDRYSGDTFIPFKYSYRYQKGKGWQTPGFILLAGSLQKAVPGPGGTLQFTPGSNYCLDTMWKDSMLHLLRTPDPSVDLRILSECKPFKVRAYFRSREFDSLKFLYFDWGDGNISYINPKGRDTTLDSLDHVYARAGRYDLFSLAENVRKCEGRHNDQISLGSFINISTPGGSCPGASYQFSVQTGTYRGAPIKPGNGATAIRWLMGDGTVYRDSFQTLTHQYRSGGSYLVQVELTDSAGCKDTGTALFQVTDVRAGIRLPARRFLCSEIIQFYDSSYLLFATPGEKITGYWWAFGTAGNFSTLKDPFKSYTQSGTYTVTHVVVTSNGCRDTIRRTVKLDGPEPDFIIDGDSVGCAPFTARFRNKTRNATKYIWYYGDSAKTLYYTTRDTQVQFTYTQPGVYYIRLYAGDSTYNPSTGQYYYCASVFPDSFRNPGVFRRVIVYGKQPLAVQAPDTICVGTPFDAEALYDSLYNRFRWNFGEGSNDTARSSRAAHVYGDTGSYRIRLSGSYPTNTYRPFCPDSSERSIRVVRIKADFTIDPASDTPEFRFVNRSSGNITAYNWDYGQPSSGKANNSSGRDGYHDYGIDTGWFRVCLSIRNDHGCEDSVCRMVYNDFYQHIYIPNVFTPNNDPYNEGYYIDIVGEKEYDLIIYNRWGQPVFKSDSDQIRWNGRLYNTGEACPEGTYYYLFRYRMLRRDTTRMQVNGVVQLIR